MPCLPTPAGFRHAYLVPIIMSRRSELTAYAQIQAAAKQVHSTEVEDEARRGNCGR